MGGLSELRGHPPSSLPLPSQPGPFPCSRLFLNVEFGEAERRGRRAQEGSQSREDELNPSRNADRWSAGEAGEGGGRGGRRGRAGVGGRATVGTGGCCGHPRPASGPCPEAWRSSRPPTPRPPCLPRGWPNASPLAGTSGGQPCLEAGPGPGPSCPPGPSATFGAHPCGPGQPPQGPRPWDGTRTVFNSL